MPIPQRKKDEDKDSFVQRCMADEKMKNEYPENKQRLVVCMGQTRSSLFERFLAVLGVGTGCCEDEALGFVEDLTAENIIFPTEYEESLAEDGEEYDIEHILAEVYVYIDPITFEIFLFDRKSNWRKNGRLLRFDHKLSAAEYQGQKVTLNKPFRTPDGPKKFAAYTKNEKGKVVIVRFGEG